MRTIMPFSVRIIALAAITFLLNSCSEENNQAGGNNVTNTVQQTDNIADGKPIIEFDSTNYNTVTFKHAGVYYVINVLDGVPYFSVIQSDARADIEITDNNEFLNFTDRAYAIIVDNGLSLTEIH